MLAKTSNKIKMSGGIKIKSFNNQRPDNSDLYYSFDNPQTRPFYRQVNQELVLDSPISLEPGDTLSIRVLTQGSWGNDLFNGTNLRFAVGSSSFETTNCEVIRVNGITSSPSAMFDEVELVEVGTGYSLVEIQITGNCTVDTIGDTNWVNNALADVSINTQSSGNYFWPIDDPVGVGGDPEVQAETLQGGPNATFTTPFGSGTFVTVTYHENDSPAASWPGRSIINGSLGDQLDSVPGLIDPGLAVQADNKDVRSVVPVVYSNGFTVMYDAQFNQLGTRNSTTRSGGISAFSNVSTDSRWSLIADNCDGSGFSRIAFSILSSGLYRDVDDYSTRVLSEIRDPSPVILGQQYRIIAVARPSPYSQIELYINNSLIGIAPLPSGAEDGSLYNDDLFRLRVGAQYTDGVFAVSDTIIDEVRFYNRALSPLEIQSFRI